MCIGNRDGGDDGIGPYVADTLKIDSLDVKVLDCGMAPENYTTIVKRHKPKTLVLIDAADMGLSAGDIRIIPKEKLGSMHISTHGMPLSVLIKYLEKEVEHVILIGIQPKTMIGEISKPIKKSAEQLINLLKKKEIHQIKIL
jgi:hydrogenase 3 maturation protease